MFMEKKLFFKKNPTIRLSNKGVALFPQVGKRVGEGLGKCGGILTHL